MTTATERYRQARDFLLENREDYDKACAEFSWPEFEHFNFALDWFDYLAQDPSVADNKALVIRELDDAREERTYDQLRRSSNQVANWLTKHGAKPGDRVLVMLDNQVELWETFLACMKLGLVVSPTTTMLGESDLQDRVDRAEMSWVIVSKDYVDNFRNVTGGYQIVITDPAELDWAAKPALTFQDAYQESDEFTPTYRTKADDLLFIYFTSGTTSKPKMVCHTHTTFPVGHLTSMYWTGVKQGDIFLNIAAPGWVAHAYSSFFAPFIVGATVFIYNYRRFDAKALLRVMGEEKVTLFQAPPTVWRMMIQSDLSLNTNPPREALSGGEPLDAHLINTVREAWGIDVRDGYGQSESTGVIANSPGQPVYPGATGRALPGVEVKLLDPITGEESDLGEICVKLDPRPPGVMIGYLGNDEKTEEVFRDGYYHMGDIASRDENGYFHYVGRADDVFKSSDYRLSPFELESCVIEHPAVAEAAVVPSPDPIRLSVPKAYVALAEGYEPNAETAESILKFTTERLAPFKRIRRIEFFELPKTVSGKIRRVDLRNRETELHPEYGDATVQHTEFTEDDFPGLRPRK